MNAFNAVVFTAFGSAMEILPKVFPSWFPPTGSDQASTRALWLAIMGAVQISIGIGFIVWAHLVPAVYRILSSVPAQESGALALPIAPGVTTR
jgi:hypothetical protein